MTREKAIEEAARVLCDAIGSHEMRNDEVGWNIRNKRDNLRAALAMPGEGVGCDAAFHLSLANDAIRIGLNGWLCECGVGYPVNDKPRPDGGREGA